MKVVVVGGVAGGASAAARLRRLDESAEIIMFERGEYISFANCDCPITSVEDHQPGCPDPADPRASTPGSMWMCASTAR